MRRGPQCTMGKLLSSVTDEERAKVLGAVERGVAYADLARALRAFGHEIKQYTVGRHFKGECSCERDNGPDSAALQKTGSLTAALDHLIGGEK